MANNVHFNSIRIRGYRGRNFDLVMNPHGTHSVFVLDGNTGKTTTIELLRWCFKFKETEAAGKFRHMWNNPAHILDHDIVGLQECSIVIEFSDSEHIYSFTRVTSGEAITITDETGQMIEDKISSIKDTLELDRGADAKHGDQAHVFLNNKFRFDQCADYFCFDGEKAKEVIIQASNRKNLTFIQDMINQRSTHPKLNKYLKSLERLQQAVYDKAKSKVTDQGKSRKINELSLLIQNRDDALNKNRELDFDYKKFDNIIIEFETERDEIRKNLLEVATSNQKKRDNFQEGYDQNKKTIDERRKELFKQSLNWVSHIDLDYINTLKYYVRESGKLPDPYYEELIESCLTSNSCKICGRELDEKSIKWIKKLEKLTAKHEVQDFLLRPLHIDSVHINPSQIREEIDQKSENIEKLLQARDSLVMSDLEKKLREQESKMDYRIKQNEGKLAGIEKDIERNKNDIENYEKEIGILENQIEQIDEYRSIIDSLKKTKEIIENTQNILKETTTKIISDVLSESVSSILGPDFSAQFSKDKGLLLGEKGRYSPEGGGMSGRLILSYTFAETMTLIDPIIIDTPSGNVGTHREALAKHLAANHRQVICLCLPTELENFSPFLSDNIINVKNNVEG
jgi:hypothetical protein